jgi:lipopolysaccharide/colanic/teichoic acid biosynthesis glycosyltransferase
MNNPELTAPSGDAFASSQSHLYPLPLDRSCDISSQDTQDFQCGSDTYEIAELEYSETTRAQTIQGVEIWSVPVADRTDHGLWLLGSSGTRHEQWERLRRLSLGNAKVREFRFGTLPEIIKRGCDVAGSFSLLIVLSPLFLLIALAIKLDSPGPVFFRHFRVGKAGKRFLLWKFRSMRVGVPQYAISPQHAADIRLTRVGRLIRRLSIDELPQLINVLMGQMSIVGPRPEMPFIVDKFHTVDSERIAVRPGITGLWQISPARAFPIHENLQYDLYYIHNRNLVFDCAIILRTIAAVIHGVGAV